MHAVDEHLQGFHQGLVFVGSLLAVIHSTQLRHTPRKLEGHLEKSADVANKLLHCVAFVTSENKSGASIDHLHHQLHIICVDVTLSSFKRGCLQRDSTDSDKTKCDVSCYIPLACRSL